MVRGEGDKASRAGDEEAEEEGEADPSRVLLANRRQHAELSLASGSWRLRESEQNPVRLRSGRFHENILPGKSTTHGSRLSL